MNSQGSSSPQPAAAFDEAPVAATEAADTGEARDKKAPSAFRTISEVADELAVQQHVLRFWETKFSQVRPLKRGGGRRYYRPEDVALLKTIHHLLYTEGYTIKGVQKLLKEQGKNKIVQNNKPQQQPAQPQQQPQKAAAPVQQPQGLSKSHRAQLEATLKDLRELRKMVGSGE